MSRRNGDRARFQKDRKRKLLHRQRVQAFVKKHEELRAQPPASAPAAQEKAAGG